MKQAAIMAAGFACLVAFSVAGGALSAVLGLPVPGPVLGLLGLVAVLIALGRVPAPIGHMSDFLVRHLNLFYIPAGVAVMGYVGLVMRDFWPILAALFVSTLGGIVVGALVFRLVARDAVEEDPS